MRRLDETPSTATASQAGWLELRIPPPVITLVTAVAMWGLARAFTVLPVPEVVRIPAAALAALAGFALSAWGIVTFRRAHTTINPHKPGEATALVVSGPYRFTRNPMYAAMLLVLLAWAAWLGSLSTLAGPVAFVLYMNRFQIAPEERALQRLFASEYLAYKSSVRRWL